MLAGRWQRPLKQRLTYCNYWPWRKHTGIEPARDASQRPTPVLKTEEPTRARVLPS